MEVSRGDDDDGHFDQITMGGSANEADRRRPRKKKQTVSAQKQKKTDAQLTALDGWRQ